LEQQRQKQGLPADDDDEYPRLFDDDSLDNMRQILLTLEKRANEGPASLSMLDVEEFVIMSQDVAKEMKEKEYLRLQDAASDNSSDNAAAQTSTAVASTPVDGIVVPPPSVATMKATTMTATPVTEATPQPPVAAAASTEVSMQMEIQKSNEMTATEDNEDGPAYDPRGGQGSLAKGTRNTYVIPNMDEMSPEEYQKALQATLFQQQEERRKKMLTGGYGNRASWDYLNNLTGESGQLKSDSAFED
jgi:hypothetical protein